MTTHPDPNPMTDEQTKAGAVFPAWYVVSCIGGATLCAGEEDALRNVVEYARDYPAFAPYVAVQLAPISTPQPPPEQAGSVGVPSSGWRYHELVDIANCLCSPRRFGNTREDLLNVMRSFGSQIHQIIDPPFSAAPAPKETP